MAWAKARKFFGSVFGRDDDEAALSRRDILAGIGLAGLLVAAPKLLTSSVAEARLSMRPSLTPVPRIVPTPKEPKRAPLNATPRTTPMSPI